MSKFVYGTELTLSIEKIVVNAQEQLLLIAPSAKLPPRLKEELRRKKPHDALHITIVFGKTDAADLFSTDELNFLKDFPNIVIAYAQNLNACYYANEHTLLFTSASLYNYQNTSTIDVGMIETAKGMFKQLAGTLTNTITETEKSTWDVATEYFADVIAKSKELFRKTPQYDKGFMNLSKKYSRSVVEVNVLDQFMEAQKPVVEEPVVEEPVSAPAQPAEEKPLPPVENKPAESPLFTTEYQSPELPKAEAYVIPPAPSAPAPAPQPAEAPAAAPVPADDFQPGYCIRTGAAIFFDPRNPMTPQALANWKKDADPEFPENYCHFSGEPSYGKTSINRPILPKNLRKAQEYL